MIKHYFALFFPSPINIEYQYTCNSSNNDKCTYKRNRRTRHATANNSLRTTIPLFHSLKFHENSLSVLDRTKGTSTNGSRSRHTAIYMHTYTRTYKHTYIQVCSSDFCGRVSQSGIWKKEKKKEKKKKKKEKTNISRLRTVNSHSRSLKKEREREKRKYLGRNWQMTETSSCSCTGHSPQGNLSRYIHIYEYIFRGYGCSQPASIELSREIHPLEEGDGFERGAELDYGRLNCTTRALFCLPSSGVLIHGARAFKVSKPRKLYCRTWGLGAHRGDTV